MFKKKMFYRVEDLEALNFCEYLGRKGLKFAISGIRDDVDPETCRKTHYRVFTVYMPVFKAKTLHKELKAWMAN